MVIVDRYGDMLSATTTIETNFGSRVVADGFLLNNELTDFAFEPEADGKPVANRVEGGKRPRSSMAPTIVFQDGRPMLLVGSPGGANIIPFVAQALVGILDFGLGPQTAIDAPHVLNRNGPTQVEAGPEAGATIAALTANGHAAEAAELNSGLQAILIRGRGADRRRGQEARRGGSGGVTRPALCNGLRGLLKRTSAVQYMHITCTERRAGSSC